MKNLNYLFIYTKLYGKLHNYKRIPYWLLSPFRRIIRYFANKVLPRYLNTPLYSNQPKVDNLIVSFTSFPARINDVWQVVETIKRQTLLPQKIILWLAKSQFPTEDSVPLSLRNRVDSLFEIRIVNEDIRSHKKYYYVFKEYNDKLVILIDDDIYYSPTMIEELYSRWQNENDKCIISSYGSRIVYDNNKCRLPYNKWDTVNVKPIDMNNFFGSGGGTLIRPKDLYKDVLNKELFLKLTSTADDIWLNAMCRLGNCKIIRERFDLILPVSIDDNVTLNSINNGRSQNDVQLENVDNYYLVNNGIAPFSFQE